MAARKPPTGIVDCVLEVDEDQRRVEWQRVGDAFRRSYAALEPCASFEILDLGVSFWVQTQ
jgi:hypothetical protein